jgi:glycosyltransferase involved in cell wall biosynthesis
VDTEADQTNRECVALIVNSYPPRLGGLESHVFRLANELTKLGVGVLVVCLADEASDTIESGVRVIRLRMHVPIASVISFPAWGTGRRLGRLLRTAGVTVVSTHTRFFPMSYVGMRAARRAGIPVIHTEHGAGFVNSPSFVIRVASRLVDLSMGRVVLGRANQVLAVSRPVADFVRRLANVDSIIFHNALQLDDWMPAGDRHSPAGIVYLGRIVGGKGWEEFVDLAADLIRNRGFGTLPVHILGDGPDFSALRDRIRSLGIEESVFLHGQSDVATIRTVLHGSVLVNPSRLAEGFQITLLEAAAAGAQIVSFPVPSVGPLLLDGAPIREVARGSSTGLADAVAEALLNPLPPMNAGNLEAHWSWPTRANEYLLIVGAVRRAESAKSDRAERPYRCRSLDKGRDLGEHPRRR